MRGTPGILIQSFLNIKIKNYNLKQIPKVHQTLCTILTIKHFLLYPQRAGLAIPSEGGIGCTNFWKFPSGPMVQEWSGMVLARKLFNEENSCERDKETLKIKRKVDVINYNV